MQSTDHFCVVFVCTGNRARSPLAEALYRDYSRGIATRVTSYGTTSVGSIPPLPEALEAAARYDVDLSSHRTRALHEATLSDADLVLGFEPFHVAMAVVDAGAPPAASFLLAELVSLLEPLPKDGDDAGRARRAVAIADSRRVRSRPDPGGVVADPLGMPKAVMFRTAEQIEELVRRLVHGLFGATQVRDRTDASPHAGQSAGS